MPQPTKAILFDMDNTLYDQTELLVRQSVPFIRNHGFDVKGMYHDLRAIMAYDKAQKTLRSKPFRIDTSVRSTQIAVASINAGIHTTKMERLIYQWYEESPRSDMRKCVFPGAAEFIHTAWALGIKLGVVSDYPTKSKIKAMGLEQYMDVQVSAQDPEVNVFKPNPKSLQRALQLLDLDVSEVWYVGNSPDYDAKAALAIGMRCVLIQTRFNRVPLSTSYFRVKGYRELREFFFT